MGLIGHLLHSIRTTLRYKLLVLVLFPIVLVMPIALFLAIYWGNSLGYQQQFIKVNTDLSVSHDIFQRIRSDYLDRLETLGHSYNFRVALEAKEFGAIEWLLEQFSHRNNFSYLAVLDGQGRGLNKKRFNPRPSSAFSRALGGEPGVGIEIFSRQELAAISLTMAESVQLELIDTPRAATATRKGEDRAMMIRILLPIKDSTGALLALLDGGVMLNSNFHFVDTIRDLVYGEGSLIPGSIGTVTVFLDDVRITTNVPLRPGERALGTRVSNEVRTHVLDRGEIWLDRAFVVNDWYISAYEPILDVDNQRVGMLYAGFLEAPFRQQLWQALILLIGLFVVLMAAATILAVKGAKSIFRPLERMSAVVHAIEDGEDPRIGRVDSQDEIGVLAREFDAMMDLLQRRNLEIQQWAEQLEDKVEERTVELRQRNDELQRTIVVLRQTRQQLVIVEKLAALGELTAGVAHEINNPTAVILGNIDVIVQELGSAAEPVEGEIELIIEQIYRIKEIINQLLHYSRPAEYAGYMALVEVNQTIHQTLALVRHLQSQEQFQINLALNATEPVEINGRELQQVLVNLVVNGVHACERGEGIIEIESEDWADKGVVVHVRDNGAGMDSDHISQIFNPFYSTKPQGEGTGLGLSVSYSMIRRYGGNITVESTPGEGAAFSVWLLKTPEMVNDEQTISEQLHSVTKG